MSMTGVSETGKKLAEAGRLKLRPLCVYGTDVVPRTRSRPTRSIAA
jgi:hypothetical protein